MKAKLSPHHVRGFTLVEIMVVIVMIAALVAISFPVVRGIRKTAGSAKTVSNLRQIQTANALFATENNGFFIGNEPFGPGTNYAQPWFAYVPFVALVGADSSGASGDHLRDAWETNYPETLKCGNQVSVDEAPRDDRNFTIAMNMSGWTHRSNGSPLQSGETVGPWVGGKILQSRIKNPDRLIMFYESCSHIGYLWGRLDWDSDEGGWNSGMAFRNKGGRCNVVFADGHVGGFTLDEIKKDGARTERYFLWNAD